MNVTAVEQQRETPTVGIVAFISRPLPELRTVLHGIRSTVPAEAQLAVVASGLEDQNATYLLRQYLRGRIQALDFAPAETNGGGHCGIDRVYRLVGGEFVARVDDTLELKPGWLERAVGALHADPGLGLISLVPPVDYHRGRGRPRTVNIMPVEVEHLELRCFVTRRASVERHEHELTGERLGGCEFQAALRAEGRRLAFLPNQVAPLGEVEVPRELLTLDQELPPHQGASGSLQRLQQAFNLGDDILLTCLSCGGTELETIAARIRFCERHQVAVGYWYELRCPECGELLYKDDYQFRCPD